MVSNSTSPSPQAEQPRQIQDLSGALWPFLITLGLLSCGGGQPPAPVSDSRAPAPDMVSPKTVVESPSSATTATPQTADQAATVQLPNTLIADWQPMSKVLLAFGVMTLTPTQIQWGSGQTSPYAIVNQEGGFLLKLETNPQFYDSPHPYLKLIPKVDENGTVTGVDVAFYESETQVQSDDYVMYGSYFLE